ncbi:Fe-only nitrogenase subunit delta [Methanomassiliicoccus luminyensis]|jgi:nitrogenase delta subunit|uniref:Fe-only nitrogenase subunit delta n=1 Tax=Methanomassiliicoccus luminyensis TaxID=1080712 RepID=UPI00036A0388|nr:Fe-only nitrogenase subunit delta [Methanomassiliicoccus luminyensis]
MEDINKEKAELLVDYIMKKCLWQFHSRAWDRERQNKEILMRTMQILCDEPVEKTSLSDRCYWVDAVCLADGFKRRYPWLSTMEKDEIKMLMQGVKDRMDFLTISGSLNEELKDPHY